ncbi:MAG: hypothetical protein ACOC8L_08735, partial [Spirochaetota bacterium]
MNSRYSRRACRRFVLLAIALLVGVAGCSSGPHRQPGGVVTFPDTDVEHLRGIESSTDYRADESNGGTEILWL